MALDPSSTWPTTISTWCYWAVNGTEGSGYGRTFGAEETFGVFDTTWTAPASSDFLASLQALVPAVLAP